jgi:hypothetical protein
MKENSAVFPRSLVETWDWKEKVYEKMKSEADAARKMLLNTAEMAKRLGLNAVSSPKGTKARKAA